MLYPKITKRFFFMFLSRSFTNLGFTLRSNLSILSQILCLVYGVNRRFFLHKYIYLRFIIKLDFFRRPYVLLLIAFVKYLLSIYIWIYCKSLFWAFELILYCSISTPRPHSLDYSSLIKILKSGSVPPLSILCPNTILALLGLCILMWIL